MSRPEAARGHSVERHLAVAPSAYDETIRRLVPGYDAMLDEMCGALDDQLVVAGEAPRILDLGCGTGRLAARLAEHLPRARLVLLDADAEMLAHAGERLAPHRDRTELVHGTFQSTMPRVDAVLASLSLHHVHDRAEKQAVYANLNGALSAGGLLVVGDAMVPAARALAEPIYRRWAAHLVAGGDTEAEARARFESWAIEDRYLGIDEELAMIASAGFAEVDVRFRLGPLAVLVARRT